MRLYGKRPVLERLKAAPHTIRAIHLKEGTRIAAIRPLAQAKGISVSVHSKEAFHRMANVGHTQGVVAEVEGFAYTDFLDLIRPKTKSPLVLFFLDRITDPQNLGAILRTLACLGGFAVVVPKHDAVQVNETVLRVACGAENYVPVARVTNLAQACEQAKQAGWWLAGAIPQGGTPIHQADWPHPIGIVLGSEGGGIRPGVRRHLELTLSLPMPGAQLSFNVATSAGLIAYEITRRRLTAHANHPA